jgi:benzoate membrane transport protein
MSNTLESPVVAPPTLRQLWADFDPRYAANGFIGWLFAATAPVAIILSVGSPGGFSEAQLASWLFGAFFVNGLITIAFCWL